MSESNIQISLNEFIYLSFYQDSNGLVEVLPINKQTGAWIGEPVRFADAGELVHIIQGCLEGDFKVFENQFVFEFEEYTNDN